MKEKGNEPLQPEQENEQRTPDSEKADGKAAENKNRIEKLYDKLPFTYKQVDIFVKVAIVAAVALIVYGYFTGAYSPLK